MNEIAVAERATPEALARLVELHARYYARAWGFGAFFEAKAAREGVHLRWFILDGISCGAGTGAALLDAARRLCESHGFRLVEERDAESWGVRAREQRFVLELRA